MEYVDHVPQKLLAEDYRKIAWLDGDLTFAQANWPLEIANRLEHANLCQVFESIGVQEHESGPPLVAPSAVRYFRETGRLYQAQSIQNCLQRMWTPQSFGSLPAASHGAKAKAH